MSPQNCPEGYWYKCEECRNHFEGRCYSGESRPINDILTDTERIARIEATLLKTQPPAQEIIRQLQSQIKHQQAQINYLEKRLIKVEARRKRYAKY